ncbi:class I SAM-dependent methyltransferase [Nakamurella deserti]|uniref:class I SAM-dependent methyltransferase n=1 Tax=Nakamurella deserti TaxID=2164074 RepID=UPI000DBE80A2|nr:class I SAM-dependent methyltransferase [Nakamurella deserti]
MSSTVTDPQTADAALKAKHRAMWASGDYPQLVVDVITPLGEALVEAAGIAAGHRVLDIAAGTGNAAIPAARRGAEVVASDLTPELLEAGRAIADRAGLTLDWQVADAEALPFPDAAFDVVMSSVGIMFAPHHATAAAEALRVCRPGGTIALLNWTPTGFVGQLFAAMKPFAPPPPPGASPGPLWGDEAHVRELFGDGVTGLTATTGTVRVTSFSTPSAFREYFATMYGPTIGVYRYVASQPDAEERLAELDAALDGLAARFDTGGGAMEWEYLIVTARRA